MTSPIERVMDFAAAATERATDQTSGLSDSVNISSVWWESKKVETTLQLKDLRVLLERLVEACGDHGACENCQEPLCETCVVGVPASCGHQDAELLCDECAPVECRECRSLERADARPDRRIA